jgi:uncharacterized coiled-coil protein SlyX
MEQAIGAFRSITATSEFREMERLRSKARHDEAQALYHARLEGALEGALESDEKWRSVVVAEKDAALADRNSEIARLREQLAALQTRLAEDK